MANIWGEYTSYDAIGSAATGATLTAAYTGNTKTLVLKYMGNFHLDIKYVPNALDTNNILAVLVEYSNDDGVTFFPRTTATDATTETDVYVNGVGSTAGIPLLFPGDRVTTGGTTYKGAYDMNALATHVKISVREFSSTAGTPAHFGTAYIRASFLS